MIWFEVHLDQGDLVMAENKLNESLLMKREILPEDHLDNGETLFAFERLNKKQGKEEKEATEKFASALKIFESKLLSSHSIIKKGQGINLIFNCFLFLNQEEKVKFLLGFFFML